MKKIKSLLIAIAGLSLSLGAAIGVGLNSEKKQINIANAYSSVAYHGTRGGSGDWGDTAFTQLGTGNTWCLTNFTMTSGDEFGFKVDGVWWGDQTTIVSQPTGNHFSRSGNLKYSGDTKAYDFFFSLSDGNLNKLYIQEHKTKIVKFMNEYNGGDGQTNWSPTNIHFFISSFNYFSTNWPGLSLSTNYGGESGLYYYELPSCFDGYVVTSGSGSSQTVDVSGSQGGDELWFFNGTKDGSGHYNVSDKSYNHSAGYYIFGNSTFTESIATAWNILGAIPSDSPVVSGNIASWASVTFNADSEFKLVNYNSDGSLGWQNGGWGSSQAQAHGWFTWSTPLASNNIVCNTAGTYKVFLTNSYQIYINRDFTIACYKVVGDAAAVSLGNTTGNSDILLSETASGSGYFTDLIGYQITGYYSDAACTEEVTLGSTYPESNMSLYAKYEAVSVNFVLENGTLGDTLNYNSQNNQYEGVWSSGANSKFKVRKTVGASSTDYTALESGMDSHTDIAVVDGGYVKQVASYPLMVYFKAGSLEMWITAASGELIAYAYAGYFLTNVNCDNSGKTLPSGWTTVKNRYEDASAMTAAAKDYIYNFDLDTEKAKDPNDDIVKMLDRYNLACIRHTELERFVKNSSGTARAIPSLSANVSNMPVTVETNNDTSLIVIVGISAVSLVAVGGYFFFRKRKEF